MAELSAIQLQYKGYSADAEYHDDNSVGGPYWYGTLKRLDESGNDTMTDLVDFISYSSDGVEMEFRQAVDDYIEFRKEIDKNA